MSENLTYPATTGTDADGNPTWVDGENFTVGNTTYAWDADPGLWRGFITATASSSSSGGASSFANAWGADGSAPVVQTNGTITGAANGTFFINQGYTTATFVGANAPSISLTNTSGNSWSVLLAAGGRVQSSNNFPTVNMGFLAAGDVLSVGSSVSSVSYWDAVEGSGGGSNTTVNVGGAAGGGGLSPYGLALQAASISSADVTGTFTIPYDGNYYIQMSGAGGSGWRSTTGGSISVGIGTGGGGGWAAIYSLALTTSDTLSYTLGKPGVSLSGNDRPGVAANDSSLTLNGDTLLSFGGAGGGGIGVGGTPGTATGGDVRFDGQTGTVANATNIAGAVGGANSFLTFLPLSRLYEPSLFLASGAISGQGGRAGTSASDSVGGFSEIGIVALDFPRN